MLSPTSNSRIWPSVMRPTLRWMEKSTHRTSGGTRLAVRDLTASFTPPTNTPRKSWYFLVYTLAVKISFCLFICHLTSIFRKNVFSEIHADWRDHEREGLPLSPPVSLPSRASCSKSRESRITGGDDLDSGWCKDPQDEGEHRLPRQTVQGATVQSWILTGTRVACQEP